MEDFPIDTKERLTLVIELFNEPINVKVWLAPFIFSFHLKIQINFYSLLQQFSIEPLLMISKTIIYCCIAFLIESFRWWTIYREALRFAEKYRERFRPADVNWKCLEFRKLKQINTPHQLPYTLLFQNQERMDSYFI